MQIYLDTANVKEIQEGANLGLIDGVTTNPSLVAKEGRSFKEMLLEICKMVDGPISAEVVGVESEAMIKDCLLYTSPSPRDRTRSRMPSSA